MGYDHKVVYRAGTIPYVVENGQVLMMFMKPSNPDYGGEAFQIAKGKVEDGEETKEAALREANEELGLFIGNITIIEDLGVFLGRTSLYVAKVKDRDMFGLPGMETGEVAWMTAEQFDLTGRDLHRPVVKAAYRKIAKLENLQL
jgi:8-oxo-dGTP pyrophosphatase MutT (NUDIX family)